MVKSFQILLETHFPSIPWLLSFFLSGLPGLCRSQGLTIIPFKLKHHRRLFMCYLVLLQSIGNLGTWLWPWERLSPLPRPCRFSTSEWGTSTSSTTTSKSSSTCWSASSDWSRRSASPLWDPSSSSHLRWKPRSPLATRNRMTRSGSKIFIRGDAASPVLLPMALSPFSRKICCCLGRKILEGTKLMLGCIKKNKTFPQVGGHWEMPGFAGFICLILFCVFLAPGVLPSYAMMTPSQGISS